MARAKKTEEMSATATEETVVAETATAETTETAAAIKDIAREMVDETMNKAEDQMINGDLPSAETTPAAEATPEFFEKVVQDLNDHKASAPSDEPFFTRKETTVPAQEQEAKRIEDLIANGDLPEGTTLPTKEERDEFMKKLREDLDAAGAPVLQTPAPEPLSARASEMPWAATHRVITDDMTCLVMVSAPYAWTHPEWDSPSGSPMLRKDDNGAWVLIDGEPFTGRVVSLDPPAPDRHTHRRQ